MKKKYNYFNKEKQIQFDLSIFEEKGEQWIRKWLINRLDGNDSYFPIDHRVGEDPEELVINIIRQVGLGHYISILISDVILHILDEIRSNAPEIPSFFGNLIHICQKIPLPKTSIWFQEELEKFAKNSEEAEHVWKDFDLIKEIIFAATKQAFGDADSNSRSYWLILLKNPRYSDYALIGLGRNLSERIQYLETWWNSAPIEQQEKKIKSLIRLARNTSDFIDFINTLKSAGVSWPSRLKMTINSAFSEIKLPEPFLIVPRVEKIRFDQLTPMYQKISIMPDLSDLIAFLETETTINLENKLVQEELNSAVNHFRNLILSRDPEEIRTIITSNLLAIDESSYSDIDDGLSTLTRRLYEEVKLQWEMKNGGRRTFPNSKRYYDLFLDETRSKSNLIIALFPFFLTENRRDTWGIIPYGHNYKIGILIHSNHMALDQIALNNSRSYELDSNWLSILIGNTHVMGGTIYSHHGYAIDEIITRSIVKKTGIAFSYQRIKEKENPDPGCRIPIGLINDPEVHNVFAFDLAEKNKIIEDMKNKGLDKFRILEIKHNLSIPLGIGYSLFLLPWLIENHRFLKLHEVALSSLGNLTDQLQNAGITLHF